MSTVIGQPIESIYPNVNENDAYCEVLNTVFIPRNKQLSSLETPIRIMWSGPENESGIPIILRLYFRLFNQILQSKLQHVVKAWIMMLHMSNQWKCYHKQLYIRVDQQ